MRYLKIVSTCILCASVMVSAESKNPADYPLRLHIFGRSQTTFYNNHVTEEAKGDGRANLFANGDVHGVDFSYECSDKVKASFGFETYPAKWKKQDKELTVLMPVFGKSNAYFTCNFKTDLKDFAYVLRSGNLISEPAADFKEWMVKHDYDPEHGKNIPVKLQPSGAKEPPAKQ